MKTPKWNVLLRSCNWYWSGCAVHSGRDTLTSMYTPDKRRHQALSTVISTSLDGNTLM